MRKLLALLLLAAGCDDSPTIEPGGPRLSVRMEARSTPWPTIAPHHETGKGELTITSAVSGRCSLDPRLEAAEGRLALRIFGKRTPPCLGGDYIKYTARISNLDPGTYVVSVHHGTQVVSHGELRIR